MSQPELVFLMINMFLILMALFRMFSVQIHGLKLGKVYPRDAEPLLLHTMALLQLLGHMIQQQIQLFLTEQVLFLALQKFLMGVN